MMGQQVEGSLGVQFISMEVSKPDTCVADEKGDFWQTVGRYQLEFSYGLAKMGVHFGHLMAFDGFYLFQGENYDILKWQEKQMVSEPSVQTVRHSLDPDQ